MATEPLPRRPLRPSTSSKDIPSDFARLAIFSRNSVLASFFLDTNNRSTRARKAVSSANDIFSRARVLAMGVFLLVGKPIENDLDCFGQQSVYIGVNLPRFIESQFMSKTTSWYICLITYGE